MIQDSLTNLLRKRVFVSIKRFTKIIMIVMAILVLSVSSTLAESRPYLGSDDMGNLWYLVARHKNHALVQVKLSEKGKDDIRPMFPEGNVVEVIAEITCRPNSLKIESVVLLDVLARPVFRSDKDSVVSFKEHRDARKFCYKIMREKQVSKHSFSQVKGSYIAP